MLKICKFLFLFLIALATGCSDKPADVIVPQVCTDAYDMQHSEETPDYSEVISLYTQCLEHKMNKIFRAAAYNNRGNAWYSNGDITKSIEDYSKAVELDPNYHLAFYNRGMALGGIGEYDKAKADFDKAVDLKPNFASAYISRGMAWDGKGEYDKAIADYNKAIELSPDFPDGYNNLGWLYATCKESKYRNSTKALAYSKKAVSLDRTSANLDTLAAAYAEAGNFEKAVETEEEAIALLTSEEEKSECREALQAYKSGKTFAQFNYGQ